MRLVLAMMSHETNTFSTIPTDRGEFEAGQLHHGGEILEPLAREIIAPALCSSNLDRFSFQQIRRPIFPPDPEAAYP